jgi:hypothetical protein
MYLYIGNVQYVLSWINTVSRARMAKLHALLTSLFDRRLFGSQSRPDHSSEYKDHNSFNETNLGYPVRSISFLWLGCNGSLGCSCTLASK